MDGFIIPALNVAVTIGLTEVLKGTQLISNRFLPLVAIVIGVGTFYIGTSGSVLVGIAVGLSAMGLFSGVKAASGR